MSRSLRVPTRASRSSTPVTLERGRGHLAPLFRATRGRSSGSSRIAEAGSVADANTYVPVEHGTGQMLSLPHGEVCDCRANGIRFRGLARGLARYTACSSRKRTPSDQPSATMWWRTTSNMVSSPLRGRATFE